MDQLVFKDLVKQMTAEAVTDLPLNVRETISSLGREDPLCSIETYGDFVQGIEELASSPPDHPRPKKRRLEDDGNVEGPPAPDPVPYTGETGPGPMPWVGAAREELQMNDEQDFSLTQVRFDVPDEKVVDLLGLRSLRLDDGLLPVTLTIPFVGSPAFVFFNVPRGTAFAYAHEIGWTPSWFSSIF
ncbi:hypothetical protein QBC33DRAFT_282425 [Phialemonium atrogriseum]|uniref:Uncharacterized protein n=1 Tax=Phialemonium atrogriseum TaxID=1093897 RepID=A0AAJ0BV19_9PEZI|nr:uncharacterized protein QBC33DRAFT_282425 [Phialemonium atrogriseum]KAK1762576.1 hypothetical protein QBC33DRAFT_282425 [Phialemonium atrogriseum]